MTRSRVTPRRRLRALPPVTATLTAMTAALILAGCTATGGGMTPEEQLRARPTFEQATAGYVTMLTEMRAALMPLSPDLRWKNPAPIIDGQGLCSAPFTKVPGAASIDYSNDALGRIPEDRWPDALQEITTIAARYRFGAPQTLSVPAASTPGALPRHVVYFHDPWGGNLSFMTEVNTILRVSSPCLRHEDGHDHTITKG